MEPLRCVQRPSLQTICMTAEAGALEPAAYVRLWNNALQVLCDTFYSTTNDTFTPRRKFTENAMPMSIQSDYKAALSIPLALPTALCTRRMPSPTRERELGSCRCVNTRRPWTRLGTDRTGAPPRRRRDAEGVDLGGHAGGAVGAGHHDGARGAAGDVVEGGHTEGAAGRGHGEVGGEDALVCGGAFGAEEGAEEGAVCLGLERGGGGRGG